KEVFWGRDLLFFAAAGPGSKLHIPFEAEEEGDFEILAQIAHSSDYGTYEVLLDGKPIVSDVSLEHEPGANLGGAGSLDAYYTEIYVAEDHMLGWKKLSQGPHVLTLVCTGKNQASSGYNLGVDTLILSRLGKREQAGGMRAAAVRSSGNVRELQAALRDEDANVRWAAVWNLTQRAAAAGESSAQLAASLRDPDPLVRGLAAVALANCGCAQTALDPLIGALADPDVNVRQRAADAIATAGKAAASAVPALIKAASSPDEEVQAQRSLANALGAIGPAAGAAIPVLERMRGNPRGRPEAESAIARIRGVQ
ncbi:MAG: HEAT repeat domain-containing protein, partial [Bryobacterales bacterium]|nr:HEAT repeat domain-containing protein [Bryobacterales bacterium]